MAKAKNKKLITIGILLVIFIVISLNFHKIKFGLSLLSLYNQDKNIETSESDQVNKYLALNNPLRDILNSSDNIDNNEVEQSSNKDTIETTLLNEDSQVEDKQVNETDSSQQTLKAENTDEIEDDTSSYLSIINEYSLVFEDLQTEFEEELNTLVQNSLEDYSKNKTSKTKLANKYLSIGSKLEKSSDTEFNKLLKDMEKKLKDNNHDTAISKDIKNYYQSFKDTRKTDLINRGMKYLD